MTHSKSRFPTQIVHKPFSPRLRQRTGLRSATAQVEILAAKMVTSMTLLAIGDAVSQIKDIVNDKQEEKAAMENKDPVHFENKEPVHFDWQRTTRQGLFGACIAAPICHVWFPFLETMVPLSGQGIQFMGCVAERVVVDQIVTGPFNLMSFVAWMSFWEDFDVKKAGKKIKQELPVLFPKSIKLWVPVHMLTFSVVPDDLRVLWIGVVSIIWGVILSASARDD